jgi:ABC-type uncharacterized transport system permease subunit
MVIHSQLLSGAASGVAAVVEGAVRQGRLTLGEPASPLEGDVF